MSSSFFDDEDDMPINDVGDDEELENPLLNEMSNKKDESLSKKEVPVEKKEVVAKGSPSSSSSGVVSNDRDREDDFSLKDSELRTRISNLKDKDDAIEIMLLLEEIIQRFDWAKEKSMQDAQEQILLTKNLKNAGNSIHNYISDMKSISNSSKEAMASFDRSIDMFQKELVMMVQEIDLSPFQKAILQNLNEALGKMPINEINNGVTHFISVAAKLKSTIDIWDEDSKKFEKRFYDARFELKKTLEMFGDVIRDAEQVSKEIRGKRFGFGALIGTLVFGSLLGVAGSGYLYQDFFGVKFDELFKEIQKKTDLIENVGVYSDPRGSYIIYDKNKMELKKDGDVFKLYLGK